MSAGQPPNFNPSCTLLIDFHFHIHFRILNPNKQWTIIYLFYFDVSVFVLLNAHNSIVNICENPFICDHFHLCSIRFYWFMNCMQFIRFFENIFFFCSFVLIFWFTIFRLHIGGRMIKLKLPTKYVLKYMMCVYVCLKNKNF